MALVYPTLSFPLLVQKASRHGGCCDWSSLNGFVLVLVSSDITSFQPLRRLGFCVRCSPAPSGVRISRCLFLLTFVPFFRVVLVLMSSDSRPVLHSLLDF